MAKAGYALATGAAVALSAATAKTVLYVLAPASFGIDLISYELAFDGVTASAVPVLVEVNTCTAASNSTPGTGSTSGTVNQLYGRSITAGFTGAYNCTSEPTVQTNVEQHLLTPVGGLIVRDYPLGQTIDTAVSSSICLRLTAPAAVNCRAMLRFERC